MIYDVNWQGHMDRQGQLDGDQSRTNMSWTASKERSNPDSE